MVKDYDTTARALPFGTYAASNVISHDYADAALAIIADISHSTVPICKNKTMPDETKCRLSCDERNGMLMLETYFEGCLDTTEKVISDFKAIQVIKDNDGNNRVVVVHFADGSKMKATLSADDDFSIETGISICITQKLLQDKVGGHCKSVYNKLIKRAMKVWFEAEDAEREKQETKERYEAKKKKIAAKKQRRKARKEAENREYEIELRKEAIVRAMLEIGKTHDKESV